MGAAAPSERRPAFWAVRPEGSRHLYLAGSFRPSLWTTREAEAERFPSEDAAIGAIRSELKGRGHAVPVPASADFAAGE
jgi:hypothetical protein